MSVNKIILENFKIFEGQHTFDLKSLNVFTGANNSGKSTLFKAISLFSKGLEKGDFPSLDLFENNVGEFKNLVNRNSKSESFKIGFFIELGEKKIPFKVLYEFVDGKLGYESDGYAEFSNIELFDEQNEFYCGFYNSNTFKVTEQNIEYDYSEFDSSYKAYPFKSPMDGNNPAELLSKFNLSNLKHLIKLFSIDEYSALVYHLDSLKAKHNNWWVENFLEEDFSTVGIRNLRLENLAIDFNKDEFRNLGDYDIKEALLFTGGNQDKILKEYNETIKRTKYYEFIESIIKPLVESINSSLSFFKDQNLAHITFKDFNEGLIKKESFNSFLFSLFPFSNDYFFKDFTSYALKIFGIVGFVELKQHLNSRLEINLILVKKKTRVKKKSLINEGDNNEEMRLFNLIEPREDFKVVKKENIANLGKGTSNLIWQILYVYSLLQKYEVENKKTVSLNKGFKKKRMINSQLILVEEPEAFLHPDWQTKLADFYVYLLNFRKNINLKILVETHSVYFIQRLQYLVASKEIKSEDVNIMFFNPETEKEKFYKMKLREDGFFANTFGPGFYDQTARLTLDIFNIENKN